MNRSATDTERYRPGADDIGRGVLLVDDRSARPRTQAEELEILVPETGAGYRWQPQAEAELPLMPTEAAGVTISYGAFHYVYQKEVTGHTYWFLQGGTVSGTSGTETVADIQLAEVGDEEADGVHHVLQITGDGVVEDGVILPGFSTTGHSDNPEETVPDDGEMKPDDHTGVKCYIDLGSWQSAVFRPSASGNFMVNYCLGSFKKTRE